MPRPKRESRTARARTARSGVASRRSPSCVTPPLASGSARTVLSAGDAVELATLGSARALGLDAEIGSLVAGKRADLTVVSLEGSPYLPVEDPAAAVVYGGTPERVLATYVDGEARYERGGMEWHELTAAAHSARRAMLAVSTSADAAPVTAPRA